MYVGGGGGGISAGQALVCVNFVVMHACILFVAHCGNNFQALLFCLATWSVTVTAHLKSSAVECILCQCCVHGY